MLDEHRSHGILCELKMRISFIQNVASIQILFCCFFFTHEFLIFVYVYKSECAHSDCINLDEQHLDAAYLGFRVLNNEDQTYESGFHILLICSC